MKGSEPELLPSSPFSPWTSPAPPSPCAKKPSGVQGLEPPGLERRDGEGSGNWQRGCSRWQKTQRERWRPGPGEGRGGGRKI